jgi:hypothetical protein
LTESKNKKAINLSTDGFLYLAEWTGLEPATPGVTGLHQKSISMRSFGQFNLPKLAERVTFFRGEPFASYKEYCVELRVAPAPKLT